jgi:uncharacterized membrane protein (DUF2068 family)
METETELIKKPAPTYYGIIGFKLLKGTAFLLVAWMMWALSDNDLPAEVQNLMHMLRVHPANKFFTHLAEQVGHLTEANVLWAAAGTLVYSLFSLVEGIGLMFRVPWAGWLAIGESAFFVPIEIYELNRPARFSWWLVCILLVNILIVWYLFTNRRRLFRHHHAS